MIIYNITFHIADDVLDDCIRFLKQEYIPFVLKDGTLTHPQLCKVLSQSEEGSSYALQFQVSSMTLLNDWWKKNGNEMNNMVVKSFGNQVTGFTTLLERLNHEVI